jgi:release factor glutamine methyltransferase
MGFAIERLRLLALGCARVTVLEVIQRSSEFLSRKGVEAPRLQTELLLAHVLKVPRLRLYLDFERRLADPELEAVRQLVKRRGAREPLQHLVGSTSFCGLEIQVTPDVLIPRPETEMLAERAWEFLKSLAKQDAGSVWALDFGTGSGCLAISLACEVALAQVCAVDVSGAALKVARANAARHGVAERVRFIQSDGTSALGKARFDLVVSNPPYIPSPEIQQLAPEVRDHDPRLALDGGMDGLQFYRRLALEIPPFLKPHARLMCEFGDGQAEAVQKLFVAAGWQIAAVEPDLSGRLRILIAHREES